MRGGSNRGEIASKRRTKRVRRRIKIDLDLRLKRDLDLDKTGRNGIAAHLFLEVLSKEETLSQNGTKIFINHE